MVNFLRLTLCFSIVLFMFSFSDNRQPGDTEIRNLTLAKGDHIAIIGNTLADRLQEDGWLETYIQNRFPDKELSFRNLGYSGDEVNLRQREEAFGTPDEWLNHVQADVIFAFFGFNESFGGADSLEKFKTNLTAFIQHSKEQKYNGKGSPQIVLFSPIANENLHNKLIPDGTENNKHIVMYTAAMSEVAAKEGVSFMNLFTVTQKWYTDNAGKDYYTINGIHLNKKGNEALAQAIDLALFGNNAKPDKSKITLLNEAVKDKDFHWFNRYRTTDGYNVYGGRSWLKFGDHTNRDVMLREMEMFDVMTSNRDKIVWQVANEKLVESGATLASKKIKADDSNLPEPVVVKSYKNDYKTLQPEPYTYLGAEEAIKKMTIPSDLKINLFASEEQFPDLVNPMQMAFDTDDRLWVVTWATYPHWNPRGQLNDKLLIFPDDNGDGKADREIVFADGLNSITGFVFWNGGVVVAAPPELYFMKDTDGDGKADIKYRLLDGLSSADSHHSCNSMRLGPDGALYYSRGIFNKAAIETPYGAYRAVRDGVYRFDPVTFEYSFHFPVGPNPHGDIFDQWGYQFATDATGGTGYYINIGKGQRARQLYEQKVRPVPGINILSSEHFPAKYNGDLLICNVIGFQGIKEHQFKYTGADIQAPEVGDLISSSDPNFRPSGVDVGGDGAVYILDWQNALIGHMQHNMRDPGRDHLHGRIYRLTAKNRPLLKPVKMTPKPVSHLLPYLRSKQNGTRAHVRAELTGRPSEEVLAELKKFAATLNPKNPADVQPLLECLWIYQMQRVVNKELLIKLLAVSDTKTRAAAVRVLGNWNNKVDNGMALLQAAAVDPQPLVRAQAILAATNFEGIGAAEIVAWAAGLPLDIQLNEQIAYARTLLDKYWRDALKEGKELSKPLTAFVLKNGTPEDLSQLKQTEEISRKILTMEQVPAETSLAALQNIEKLTGKNKVQVLLEQMGKKEGAASNLYTVFTGLPAAELTQQKAGIWALLNNESATNAARAAAATALIKTGEQPSAVFHKVAGSNKGTGAFLTAINQSDAQSKEQNYTLIKTMLMIKTSKLSAPYENGTVAKLGMKTLLSVPEKEEETFTMLNGLLETGRLETDVINTLSEMDTKEWPENKIRSLSGDLLKYLQKVPALKRDQSAFTNGKQLLQQLANRLPKEERLNIKTALIDLQMIEISINSITEQMKFDITEFKVIAGQPVKITFKNPDAMPHNVVILNPGKAQEVGELAGKMVDGVAKNFIPDSKEILAHTKLVKKGEVTVIKFIAPKKTGDYDYICSFPGHWSMMRGVMKVQTSFKEDYDKYRVVYKGDSGPGVGKKIVFISTDHEYRSEESLPEYARILAKRYGFTCTVVWGLDDKGYILPGSSNLRGLDVLDDADLMVIFTRFANFADEEMQHIDDYLERGGPVVGFRTATHAFNNKGNAKWGHYDYGYNGPMKEWKEGFGKIILGETWAGHYGTNHVQASKLIIEDAQKEHPIMRGVKDPWAQSGGYEAYPEKMGATVLARGEVLNGMTPDAAPDSTKKQLPVAWFRDYHLPSGKSGRAFATTHGASQDLLSEGFRRMAINAFFWAMYMEDQIKPDNNIDFVGPYKPTTFNFDGYKVNVKPSDLAGWDSLIMPGEVLKPKKK